VHVTTPDVQTVDAASVQSALTWHDAISALRQTLQAGLEPEDEPCRGKVAFGSGQLLMMPSTVGNRAGIKLASDTVTPANPRWGLPRIQATYLALRRGYVDANCPTRRHRPHCSAHGRRSAWL